MIVNNQENIKVHFAAAEVYNQYIIAKYSGVQYFLYTAFPFVERMIFEKANAPIMPMKNTTNPYYDIPQNIIQNNRHTIQDSGLFTLMFGSQKNNANENLIDKWYDKLVEFSLQNSKGATLVEVDCQKIAGVEKAWQLRKKMKQDCPHNRIINVFHIEDGQKGLDRMIEFSDYIAISVPELRFLKKKNYTYHLAHYIKNKKPEIDIHLLGCTELKMLKDLNFCSSADSTTWVAPKRFGYIKGNHIRNIKTEQVQKLINEKDYQEILRYNNEQNTNAILLNVYHLLNQYTKYAGSQK